MPAYEAQTGKDLKSAKLMLYYSHLCFHREINAFFLKFRGQGMKGAKEMQNTYAENSQVHLYHVK